MTSDSTISVDSARFIRSPEDTTGNFPDEGPACSTDVRGEALNKLSVRDGMEVEEVSL